MLSGAGIFRAAVGAGVVAVLTGCGAPAAKEPLDAAFLAKANAACQPLKDYDKAHSFPLKSFDPDHPSKAELATVGDYFAASGGYRDVPAKLDALGEPAEHAADWDTLRSYVRQLAAVSTQQATAAQQQDVPGFVETVHHAQGLTDQISPLAYDLGFTTSSACGSVFG